MLCLLNNLQFAHLCFLLYISCQGKKRRKRANRNTRDVNSDQFCWLLDVDHGDNPFMECLEELGYDLFDGFHESCVIDITATENEDDKKNVACDIHKLLIRECTAVGIYIDPTWTDLTGCRKSVFSLVLKGHICHSIK